jgi:hypothetical protein
MAKTRRFSDFEKSEKRRLSLESIVELFPGFEFGDGCGFDGDLFTRLRIAAFTGFATDLGKCSESNQRYFSLFFLKC